MLAISDETYAKLTSVVGRLMAETAKMKTYSDAIEALLSKSMVLSPELLSEVESFVKENVQLGYTTKEEFVQDAIRFKLAGQPDQHMECSSTSLGSLESHQSLPDTSHL